MSPKQKMLHAVHFFVTRILMICGVVYVMERCVPAAEASDYRLFQARELDFQWESLRPSSRDPYVPHVTGDWRERATLHWNMGLLGNYVYWNNWLHTETVSSGTVKTVGWKWEVGIDLIPQITPIWTHHSRHVMEEAPEHRFGENNQFPVEDSYGFRINLIPGGNK